MNNTFKSNSNSNQLNSADEQRTILQSATQLNTSMNMVTENELQVLQSDTINPTLEPQTLSTQSTIIKKSSKKCPFGDCSDKPVKIIGECRYCTLKYCSRYLNIRLHFIHIHTYNNILYIICLLDTLVLFT